MNPAIATSTATAIGTMIGGVKYFIMVTSSSWVNSEAISHPEPATDRPAHNCAIEGKSAVDGGHLLERAQRRRSSSPI
jgi:hypothetical protein